MKIYFPIFLCLFISVSSIAQVELKGFITGSSQNNTFLFPTFTNESQGINIAPSVAIAFNRDNKFHELQLLNISFFRNEFSFTNPSQTQNQRTRSASFRYSYNFYFLQDLEKWSPFFGFQTTQSFFLSRTTTQPSSATGSTISLTNYQGIVLGVHYTLKDNVKLEFAIPTNLSMFAFSQDSFNSRTEWEIGVDNPLQFRLGCSVLL